MLFSRIVTSIPRQLRRNFGATVPAVQKANDPIQQLFLDKIKEFKTQSAKMKGAPELEEKRQAEMEKISKQFGVSKGTDMTSFPSFKFDEPDIQVNDTPSKE